MEVNYVKNKNEKSDVLPRSTPPPPSSSNISENESIEDLTDDEISAASQAGLELAVNYRLQYQPISPISDLNEDQIANLIADLDAIGDTSDPDDTENKLSYDRLMRPYESYKAACLNASSATDLPVVLPGELLNLQTNSPQPPNTPEPLNTFEQPTTPEPPNTPEPPQDNDSDNSSDSSDRTMHVEDYSDTDSDSYDWIEVPTNLVRVSKERLFTYCQATKYDRDNTENLLHSIKIITQHNVGSVSEPKPGPSVQNLNEIETIYISSDDDDD